MQYDLLVLEHIRTTWAPEMRRRFAIKLYDLWSARDAVESTDGPTSLLELATLYEVGDYSYAALMTLEAEEEQKAA